MTSWKVLPWQLKPSSNAVKTAASAITTHASSSCYHLNINYNQTNEVVQLNFLPPAKKTENKIKKTYKTSYKHRTKNMHKPILAFNDTSNKSIQVPSVIRKNNVKEKRHRKRSSRNVDQQPLVATDSVNTNVVYEKNGKLKEDAISRKSDKKKKHRHRRERSRETLVTITDTVSIEHCTKDQYSKNKPRKHNEPSHTPTGSENVSAETCKDPIKKHKQQRDCSEDTITITATLSKSNSNEIKGNIKEENKKGRKEIVKHKENTKKKEDKVDPKQQQKLEDIITNFETVSGKNAQIYYIHSVAENDPEIAPVLRGDNKDIQDKRPNKSKRKRKQHSSLETKCKDIQNTTSSSSGKFKSRGSYGNKKPVENKKEGIRFFFIKNKNQTEGEQKRACTSKERRKSGESTKYKHGTKEIIPSRVDSTNQTILEDACVISKNRSQSVDSKTFKNQVNRDSVETLHRVGDVGVKVAKTSKTIRCASQDQSGNKVQPHRGYSKRQSKSETNLKHKKIDSDMLKENKDDLDRKSKKNKDKEKHYHKTHHKVETSEVEVLHKKKVEGNSVIEKLFFKKSLLKNKSKYPEHRTKNEKLELENKKIHENLNSTNSTDVRDSRDYEKGREHSKKRKRSKKTIESVHSGERKASKHKIIESTGTGEGAIHKHHKKSRKSEHHRKFTTTDEMSPKTSEEIQKKHVPTSSTEEIRRRKSRRRKEKDRHSHTKHSIKFENISKSTLPTEQELAASGTDNSDVLYQLTAEKKTENKNKVIKGETKKIIKITKQQLEAILNQINKKHNLQQSKTLHYKLPDEKTEPKKMRKEVSFSHLNLKPVVAYYASPAATLLNSFTNGKQFDCMSTYNSILSFPKDKRSKRKTKIPDHKSVVSEAITKKEKFQYVCGRRYSTNRAARNFAYSENVFERSKKALRENGSSTVGFTVEGVEPPKRLKPEIIPSYLIKDNTQKDLTVAIVTGIDIQPKYGKEITRSLSLLNTVVDGDFTDGRGLSDASERLQGFPNAKTFTSLLSESRQSSLNPLGSRIPIREDYNFRRKSSTPEDICFKGIQKFFQEDELDKDQLAALGQEVFNRMKGHYQTKDENLKEQNLLQPRNPRKEEKLRPSSRGSSVSSKRSVNSSPAKKFPRSNSINEMNKPTSPFSITKRVVTKDISLEESKTKSNTSYVSTTEPKRSVSRNSSIISDSPRSTSPKKHLNTPVRDNSPSLPGKKDSSKKEDLLGKKDDKTPASREISPKSVKSSSPNRIRKTPINDPSKEKRPTSGRTASVDSRKESNVKSRESSNESSKITTNKHISLYDRTRMQFKRKSVGSPKEKKILGLAGATKIPIRIPNETHQRKSLNNSRSPSEKEHSLDRNENRSNRTSSDRKPRTRSSGSTSSEFSTKDVQNRSSKLQSGTKVRKVKPIRSLQTSETFLCDSFNGRDSGGVKNVEGSKSTVLGKITEETSSQNLLDNKYSNVAEKLQDPKGREVENKIEGHLKNLSNEIFESIIKMLNNDSSIKQRFLPVPNPSEGFDHPPGTNKEVLNVTHKSGGLGEIENIAEKDQLKNKPKEIQDRPPEIKCSSCSINVQGNRLDSDAESEVWNYFDDELFIGDKVHRKDSKKFLNRMKQFSTDSLGKSKIPKHCEKIIEEKEEAKTLKVEELKIKEKRGRSVKHKEDSKDKTEIKHEKDCSVNSDHVEENTKEKLVTDCIKGAGEQLDGKEIQRLSNLVKQNVMKELGAANLLKPQIVEEKPKQGENLDDIIERSIATALNQRVYSVMHSVELNDGGLDTNDGKEEGNSPKENNSKIPQEHKPTKKNKKPTPVVVKPETEDKKAEMIKKLTAMLSNEPDFLGLESRLDNMLGIQSENKSPNFGNSQIINLAGISSKTAFSYKKSNQIAYTVPAKRCKMRKSRLKLNPANEIKRKIIEPKGNIPKTQENLGSLKENKNGNNPRTTSKIPTLIKPPITTTKCFSKLPTSDTSESYHSKTRNITKSLNSVVEEENIAEDPNSARYLTKLLDIELVDHSENQLHPSVSTKVPSKAKTSSSINTKSRPLSAYEKRKLYGEQLRLKKINSNNSKNEPSSTVSTEPEKGSNEDCMYCYPKDIRGDVELQKQSRHDLSSSKVSPKFPLPQANPLHYDYNNRSHAMGRHQESDADIPTLGCYLCTKLHCNSQEDSKILPLPFNKYPKPSPSWKDLKQNPERKDENIYQAYSVLTDYPNVQDVFRNKFKTGSSISLFSRESMFSCDNILPCISPRSAASNCSLNTFHSRSLYNTKSSSLLNAKYANEDEETKRNRRMVKASRIRKKNGMGNISTPSKMFLNTIEQNSKDSFNQKNSQLNLTPSYEFCHSTPEYTIRSGEERAPFFTRSAGISRRKGNLLETCQHLRNRSRNRPKKQEDSSSNEKDEYPSKPLEDKYKKVNRKTFFKDTKSLIYQSLEKTSKTLNKNNRHYSEMLNQKYRENRTLGSECDLSEPYIETSSVNNVFEEQTQERYDNRSKTRKSTPITKYNQNRNLKLDSSRDLSFNANKNRYKIKSTLRRSNKQNRASREDHENTPSTSKDEEESFTIFKLDKDFQIQKKRKKHLEKNQSEECFKIFAYNNIIELDMDYPIIYKNKNEYEKGRLRREVSRSPETPTSENTESGYGSSKSKKSTSLRKFFPQEQTVLDAFTSSFRCFDQEVYVGKVNPLSRVTTTFPVNTGGYSRTDSKPESDSSPDYEPQSSRNHRQRRTLFRNTTPTSDSDFSNEPYTNNQSFKFKHRTRDERPVSHLYNIDQEDYRVNQEDNNKPNKKLCTTEYDKRPSVNFDVDFEDDRKPHRSKRYNEKYYEKPEKRSKIPQKLKQPMNKYKDFEELEDNLPFVCNKHKPLLCLKQKLLSKTYMRRECHNVDEEHGSSNYRRNFSEAPIKPHRRTPEEYAPLQRKLSNVWQLENNEYNEEGREEIYNKPDPNWKSNNYKEPVHGGRFKDLIRSISRPFTKRSNETSLDPDDQCSAYTTSSKESEPNQKYFWFKNKNRNVTTQDCSSRDIAVGESKTQIKNFKRLQKQVDQCHEYANKVCTESRLRQEGHLKQFVDFKEIPLSILLGKKNSQATESVKINSSKRGGNRSINFPPKLKVLDDAQRSKEVLTLKSLCEDDEDKIHYQSHFKKAYFHEDSVCNLKNISKNKPLGSLYTKETCKALRDLLEHTECTKKACESLRNCLRKSDCTKETYDLKNALKESDCSEETCKNLRKLLKELRETFLEGTEGTSVNLKNVSKDSLIPLKELLDMGFQKLLDSENEPLNEVSTELMRLPSGTISSRTSSQHSLKELLDLPYEESTTETLPQDQVVPLRELLDRVFDELLSTASKNSGVSSKISTHFIKSPSQKQSFVSMEKPPSPSDSAIATSNFIKLTKSPGKTSLKRSPQITPIESADNKKRLSIESSSFKEVPSQSSATSQVDQLLKELSQKTTENLFESFKEQENPAKSSLTELYPTTTQSSFKNLRNLSKESKELLQITLQKVLSRSKESFQIGTPDSSLKESSKHSDFSHTPISVHGSSSINESYSHSSKTKGLSKDSKEILEDIFQKLLTLSKEPSLKQFIPLPAELALVNPGKQFLTELSISEYSGTSSDLKPFSEEPGPDSHSKKIPRRSEEQSKEGKESKSGLLVDPTQTFIKELLQYYVEVPGNPQLIECTSCQKATNKVVESPPETLKIPSKESSKEVIEKEKSLELLPNQSPTESLLCACKYLMGILKEPLSSAPKEAIIQILKSLATNLSKESKEELYPNIQNLFQEESGEAKSLLAKESPQTLIEESFTENSEEPLDLSIKEDSIQSTNSPESIAPPTEMEPQKWQCTKSTCPKINPKQSETFKESSSSKIVNKEPSKGCSKSTCKSLSNSPKNVSAQKLPEKSKEALEEVFQKLVTLSQEAVSSKELLEGVLSISNDLRMSNQSLPQEVSVNEKSCIKCTCGGLRRPCKEPPGTSENELPMHVVNPDSHEDFIDSSSSLPKPQEESHTSMESAPQDFIQASSELPSGGCTKMTCKKLKQPSREPLAPSPKIESHTTIKSSSQDFVEASSEPPSGGCTKMTCNKFKRPSNEPLAPSTQSHTTVKSSSQDFVEASSEPMESHSTITSQDFHEASSVPPSAGCTRMTCKQLQHPSVKSIGTCAKEASVPDVKELQAPEDPGNEEPSGPLTQEEQSQTSINGTTEDLVEALPAPKSTGCTNMTCKNRQRPSRESVGKPAKEDSVELQAPEDHEDEETSGPLRHEEESQTSIKNTTEDLVEALPAPKSTGCTNITCKNRQRSSRESVGKPAKEDSVPDVMELQAPDDHGDEETSGQLRHEEESQTSIKNSPEDLQASSPPVSSGCTNTTCKSMQRPPMEGVKTPEKEVSVPDVTETSPEEPVVEVGSTKTSSEHLEKSSKESTGTLPEESRNSGSEETETPSPTIPLQCTRSTCTSLNYIPVKSSPPTKEASVQKTNSSQSRLSKQSKELLEEVFKKLSTEPSKETLEEAVAKLINLSKEITASEEVAELPACTNSTCAFQPEATEDNKVEEDAKEETFPKTKSPCECPGEVSEEVPARELEEIADSGSAEVDALKEPSASSITSAPKEENAKCSNSACQFLKDLPKGSRELLENALQNVINASRQSSINSLSVVPEEPSDIIEEEELVEIEDQKAETDKEPCTCSGLMVSRTASKSSSQKSSPSVESNDSSVVIEGTLIELAKEEEPEVPKDESMELSESASQNSGNEPEGKEEECICEDLISFAEESRELLDIPLENSKQEPVSEEPLEPITQEEVKESENLPQCQCPDFATQSQESIELSNTIFPKSSQQQCLSVQINEIPHIIESISGTSKDLDSIFSNYNNLTGFPKREEFLLALHTIINKNPLSGGKSSKKVSKKTDKTNKEESPHPESSSEIPEELFKQLCEVSLKTMMELYDKVAENKEMKMSFKAIVEELCKNKLKEEKLSGTATQSQLNVIQLLKHYKGEDTPDKVQEHPCDCAEIAEQSTKDKPALPKTPSRSKKKGISIKSKKEETPEAAPKPSREKDAGVAIKSEKGVTNFKAPTEKTQDGKTSPLKELRESLTDKELFEKLLDSYEKEENIVERLSNDDEFFQSQLESVNSKESVGSLLKAKEEISRKSEEQLLAALNLDSFSDITKVDKKKRHSTTSSIARNAVSVESTSSRSSKGKGFGFSSRMAKLFKSDATVKEIVAPRADGYKHSIDVSYLGKSSNSIRETDEETELVQKSISNDDLEDSQKVTFTKGRFEEEKKLFGDDTLVAELEKSKSRKSSTDSNASVVKPSELGKCFLRGFRSDYVSLGGDTCLLISNQEKERARQQGLKNESYIEFSERDTPLEYLLALGFSIDEASNAIKDEDVKNRLFAAITEARIWINQISTVQGTLLYLIAYKAKPRIMRYYLQLVEAIINRRIQNAVKLDAFLRVLEKVEDGDLTMINIIGSDKFDDEENEEKLVKKQLRQLFINVYKTAENEANLKNKPLSKEGIVLLRILAAKYRAGLHPHLELIARYIGQSLLRNEVQLEAAMIYLSRLDTADVDLNEFEQYCGIVCKEKKPPASGSKPS